MDLPRSVAVCRAAHDPYARIDENNPVRVVDVFVDEFELAGLGFNGVDSAVIGRPSFCALPPRVDFNWGRH
jgi:hypothetical protein